MYDPQYTPAHNLLAGRVILVTGAGDGIGRAVAVAFARHEARVVLLGRTVEKLERVYDEIVAGGSSQPAIYPMDLLGASAPDYEELMQRLATEFGRLDGLLHNAGLLGTLAPIEHYDLETWAKVLHVNLYAPFLLTRACMPLLKKSTDASVVFTSSNVGRRGRAYWGAYSVSKFALEGMMQTLADEVDPKTLRVNSLNPGRVRTAMRAAAYPAEDPRTLLRPEDVVGPYLFLMGADSRGVNGEALDAQ